jgi:hypothetical protein
MVFSYFKRVSFVILLFLFVYNPPFKFLSIYPGFIISLFSIVLLISHSLSKKQSFYSLKNIFPFSFILILTIYSFIIVFIHESYEFAIAKGYILFIIAYIIGPYIILHILKKRNELDLNNVLKYFILISVIQSVIMILMLLFPNLKEFFFSIQKDDRQFLHLESGGFRMLGLAYGVVWDLGFIQSLSTIFIVWLLPRLKNKNHFWLYSFAYLLIFISIVMSGRTGFFGIFISILLLLYNFFVVKKNVKYYGRFLLSLLITSFLTFKIIYASISPDLRYLLSDKIIPWAFEMFINSNEGNGLETKSSNNLKDMYFEVSTSTFLFGDGYYSDPTDKAAYYLGTDAGYMRQLLFYGLFGSIMLYSFYLLIFKKIMNAVYNSFDKSTILMFFLIAFYYFFAHVKGDVFMGGDMPLRVLFILYFLLDNKLYSKSEINNPNIVSIENRK